MKILFLSHRLPYAPNRGDRIRSFHTLREMSRFADVSLFSLVHDDDEEARARSMPFVRSVAVARVRRVPNLARCAAALPTGTPLTHVLLDGSDARARLHDLVGRTQPDLVYAYCSGVARYLVEPPLAGLPFVLDMVDVDSAKWARFAREHRGPRGWVYRREARVLKRFEAEITSRARLTLVVNRREQALLERIAPDARVAVVENGIDLDGFRAPAHPPQSSTVVFCGVMNYAPNEDAVQWFAREVWPRVRERHADARFVVVGSSPTRAIRALASARLGIEVTGAVDAVQPFLWDAAVSVAPLRLAQGLQNKVLEALAAGLPVVTTSAVAAGLPEHALSACDVADDPARFAAAVIGVLEQTPDARRDRAARAHVAELSWESRLAGLGGLLHAALRDDARPLAGHAVSAPALSS